MTEVQRSQWLLSMPSYAVVNEAMQNLTDVGYHTNNQAVSQGNGRQEMLTPPRHGTGLVCPGARVCPPLVLNSIWD